MRQLDIENNMNIFIVDAERGRYIMGVGSN